MFFVCHLYLSSRSNGCPHSVLFESCHFTDMRVKVYSKFDKHQDLAFVFHGILVMEYPNSVTDM